MAKQRDARRADGSRMRCTGCGHPRVEHRASFGCSVPQCPCSEYGSPVADEAPEPVTAADD